MITRRALLAGATAAFAAKSTPPPQPFGALPSARQLAWHELECTAFLHFTVNTFTNKEWGYGDEDPDVFNPEKFDADAIVSALAGAGMRGVILTAKHHDGFCLWPTKTTDHSVFYSKWRGGKGDVVRDVSQAAARHGLKFGVYLSPWDRNSKAYGTPEYIKIYRAQLTELLTGYGPIFEVWHDGANGGDGFYGGAREKRAIDRNTYYDWPKTWEMVRAMQPDACIFSDVGPDIRWVGNERGIAGDPCWDTFDPVGEDGGPASPGNVRTADSNTGNRNGKQWMPAECDVSIRPGWFWHEAENARVKKPAQLVNLYYQSAGRGATLLLNVPPNRDGLLSAEDLAALQGFGAYLRGTFTQNLAAKAKTDATHVRGSDKQYGAANLVDGRPDTYWATDDKVTSPDATLDLGRPAKIQVIRLREAIRFGQRIDAVTVERWQPGGWEKIATATSIGARRLIRLESPVIAARLRLRIEQASASPALSEFSVFSEAAIA
ncbi:MAG TPA: alpha-L-fucosidase [Candidatus Acidoferrales bacterium]|nr:alpha-L-fucosidase [Candidatus Acidoferrales bacterium]